MSDEESSFVILGSTPTPSMEQYNGHENSITNETVSSVNHGNMMQSSTQTIKNFSLLHSLSLSATNGDNPKNDAPVNSMGKRDFQLTQSAMEGSTASVAEQFLMGEVPADSLKVSFMINMTEHW